MPEEEQVVEASTADNEAAFQGPAALCNRMYLNSGSVFVRLAFAEQSSEFAPVHFRAAVSLTLEDAWTLNDMLTRALSRI